MHSIIQGVSVTADLTVSQEQISQIVAELIQTWAWEGRQLGKIELMSDGQLIHICSYEKPSIQLVPLNNS